jgi:hypothetical protein
MREGQAGEQRGMAALDDKQGGASAALAHEQRVAAERSPRAGRSGRARERAERREGQAIQ